MTMSLKDSEGAWAKYTCVVPLVDMMNTGYPEEINTVCRTTDDSKFVECLAIKDIKGGEEVFVFLKKISPMVLRNLTKVIARRS